MKNTFITGSIFFGPFMTNAHRLSNGRIEVVIIKSGQPNERLTFSEFKRKYETEKGTTWYNAFANFYWFCENQFKRRGIIK